MSEKPLTQMTQMTQMSQMEDAYSDPSFRLEF